MNRDSRLEAGRATQSLRSAGKYQFKPPKWESTLRSFISEVINEQLLAGSKEMIKGSEMKMNKRDENDQKETKQCSTIQEELCAKPPSQNDPPPQNLLWLHSAGSNNPHGC